MFSTRVEAEIIFVHFAGFGDIIAFVVEAAEGNETIFGFLGALLVSAFEEREGGSAFVLLVEGITKGDDHLDIGGFCAECLAQEFFSGFEFLAFDERLRLSEQGADIGGGSAAGGGCGRGGASCGGAWFGRIFVARSRAHAGDNARTRGRGLFFDGSFFGGSCFDGSFFGGSCFDGSFFGGSVFCGIGGADGGGRKGRCFNA